MHALEILPLELWVDIALLSPETWYSLSLAIREVGMFSLQYQDFAKMKFTTHSIHNCEGKCPVGNVIRGIISNNVTVESWRLPNGDYFHINKPAVIVKRNDKTVIKAWLKHNFHRLGMKPALTFTSNKDKTKYWFINGYPPKSGLIEISPESRVISKNKVHVHYFKAKKIYTKAQNTIWNFTTINKNINNWVIHRDGDKPAYITYNNKGVHYIGFYKNNKLHRENGPASILTNPCKENYYYEGKLHRDNGPAVYDSGSDGIREMAWYKHGKLHRESGPARIKNHGSIKFMEWRLDDELDNRLSNLVRIEETDEETVYIYKGGIVNRFKK